MVSDSRIEIYTPEAEAPPFNRTQMAAAINELEQFKRVKADRNHAQTME